MMKKILFLSGVLLASAACARPAVAAKKTPKPAVDLPQKGGTATAVFAAGCFWCVEAAFEGLTGVKNVRSGYAGDTEQAAKYKIVSSGATKHAEAVEIVYDPSVISYGTLLQVLFSLTDPTTLNYQGPDHGTQYRHAIFYASDAEKDVARKYIAQLTDAKVYPNRIVTSLEPLTKFYPAEDYHQDFVKLHPDHGYVRMWAIPKVEKRAKLFPQLVAKQ